MILKRWLVLDLIMTTNLKLIDDFNTDLLNPSARSVGTKWQEERLEPMRTVKQDQNQSIRKQLCKALESGSMYSTSDCK